MTRKTKPDVVMCHGKWSRCGGANPAKKPPSWNICDACTKGRAEAIAAARADGAPRTKPGKAAKAVAASTPEPDVASAAAATVACTACGAQRGQRCVTSAGNEMGRYHAARVRLADAVTVTPRTESAPEADVSARVGSANGTETSVPKVLASA